MKKIFLVLKQQKKGKRKKTLQIFDEALPSTKKNFAEKAVAIFNTAYTIAEKNLIYLYFFNNVINGN
jgi:hypothetical protein